MMRPESITTEPQSDDKPISGSTALFWVKAILDLGLAYTFSRAFNLVDSCSEASLGQFMLYNWAEQSRMSLILGVYAASLLGCVLFAVTVVRRARSTHNKLYLGLLPAIFPILWLAFWGIRWGFACLGLHVYNL
jgi:hypothetical protein